MIFMPISFKRKLNAVKKWNKKSYMQKEEVNSSEKIL